MKASKSNFWTDLESKQISNKEQAENYLLTKLGAPANPTQQNLATEILKKINSYYFAGEPENQTFFSLIGSVSKITQRPRKTGKHKGETKFVIELAEKEILQAYQEDLPKAKWQQLEKLTILGQNLAFKYKKFITNKQLVDFYPISKKQNSPKTQGVGDVG